MTRTPSLPDLFRVFARIGWLSFGGPAAQIALMQRELVDERGWLSEDQFLRALSFCMLLPGPEAMQLATYAGWRLRGTLGGLLAGLLFVLPGAVIIVVLAGLYVTYGARPAMQDVMLGVQGCVIVIVALALRNMARKALIGPVQWGIGLAAFIAIFFFALPFPVIIAIAAGIGAMRTATARSEAVTTGPSFPYRSVILWVTLWLLPLAVLHLTQQPFLLDLGLFFAKLAVVTFGGAYAVLAYMTQEVVQNKEWLDTAQMIDALGLAETTPGPLILVTQFVGHLAGHAQGGAGMALVAGILVLWMTFVPCFLWVFTGAPYLETLTNRPRIASALSAVTAAVSGVILNLSLWFALQVLWTRVDWLHFGPLRLPLLQMGDLNPAAIITTALAALLMGALRQGVITTLVLCALCAAGIGVFF